MLSICITVKNRSRVLVGDKELRLLPKCIQSIARSVGNSLSCELVLSDWQSDDWPLREWLSQYAGAMDVKVVAVSGEFCRGRGRNLAADSAKGDVLFFLDADSLICPAVIGDGIKCVQQGKAYFPILYSFRDPDHQSGWWREEGYGNCMVSRQLYKRVGGWPQQRYWGQEDDDFFARISSVAEVVRPRVPDFYHQWHPDDVAWKDRYVDRSGYVDPEVLLAKKVVQDLGRVIPPGETFILIDEAQLGNDPLEERYAVPFLERNGQYWGPPADDTVAIAELERLRKGGASFVAFAWMAFWWLDYYRGLHHHLSTRFRRVLNRQYLAVYDLREQVGVSNGSLYPSRRESSQFMGRSHQDA